jgi:hypothetical protein
MCTWFPISYFLVDTSLPLHMLLSIFNPLDDGSTILLFGLGMIFGHIKDR